MSVNPIFKKIQITPVQIVLISRKKNSVGNLGLNFHVLMPIKKVF